LQLVCYYFIIHYFCHQCFDNVSCATPKASYLQKNKDC